LRGIEGESIKSVCLKDAKPVSVFPVQVTGDDVLIDIESPLAG
jgi:hypothetical protein